MAFGKRRRSPAAEGRIQVSTYSGRPIVDPSEEALRDLVLSIARDPDELVVVASSGDPDGTYVQALCRSDGRWVVETQDGSEESHAHAFVPDVHAVAAIIGLWVAGDPAWRTAADWREGYGA